MVDDLEGGASVMAEDKGSAARPPRGSDHQAVARRGRRGVAGWVVVGGVVKEGSATDQEESGGQQRAERGRPSSASSAKSVKAEDLASLRIGVSAGGEAGTAESDGAGGGGGGLLFDGVEHRGRQDSSRSPLPHENAAGGEDDASVLDTPLQDKVSTGRLVGRNFSPFVTHGFRLR